MQGSPNSASSAPAALRGSSLSINSMNEPPRLPTELGSQEGKKEKDAAKRKQALEAVNKRFLNKNSLEKEREQNAIRKANALMMEATRSQKPEKKLIKTDSKPVGRVVIVPDGREHLASSTREKKKQTNVADDSDHNAQFEENVDDFKCELDREREKWAQKQALRMIRLANRFT
jgi:hypothetical protein